MKKVGILMGSDSDLPILQKAMDMLESLEVPYECHIYSAHRTPVEARDFAVNARANGFGALICAAGIYVLDKVQGEDIDMVSRQIKGLIGGVFRFGEGKQMWACRSDGMMYFSAHVGMKREVLRTSQKNAP